MAAPPPPASQPPLRRSISSSASRAPSSHFAACGPSSRLAARAPSSRPPPRGRRATIEVGLTTLLEAFAIFVVCLLLFTVAVGIHQVFFGPDKEALNTYELLHDNMASLLAAEEEARSIDFTFTHPLTTSQPRRDQGYGVSIEGRASYEGTIWAVDSEGRVSRPFPAWAINAQAGQDFQLDPSRLDPPLAPGEIDKECRDAPCLCFSKRVIPQGAADDELRAILKRPTRCRAFELGDGESLRFDFTQPNFVAGEEQYPDVRVRKTTTEAGVTLHLHLTGTAGQ